MLRLCGISETEKAWEFVRYKALNAANNIDKKLLIKSFKEALTEYKYNGLPEGYNTDLLLKPYAKNLRENHIFEFSPPFLHGF